MILQAVWSKKLKRKQKFRVPLKTRAKEGELTGNLNAPVCLFIGAGMSKVFGAPLAYELFKQFNVADVKWKSELINRVTKISPSNCNTEVVERFIEKAKFGEFGRKLPFPALVKFIGLHIMYSTADAGSKWHNRRGHNVCGFFKSSEHVELSSKLFGGIGDKVSILTTNYDVILERMLSPQNSNDVLAPGFSYEGIATELESLGDPGNTMWGRPVIAAGKIAICKLHGSLSWKKVTNENNDDELMRMTDCSPANNGQSYIVPPMLDKNVEPLMKHTWDTARKLLSACRCLVFIGYSLPEYDIEISNLLRESLSDSLEEIAIFDPKPTKIVNNIVNLTGKKPLVYRGMPEAADELREIINKY